MKRIFTIVISLTLVFVLLTFCLTGCGEKAANNESFSISKLPRATKDYDVYAYYFPNWGAQDLTKTFDPFVDCEWGTIHRAISRFEGHMKPNVPLWGYENHSDPEVMSKIITAATTYGVDGFIFDWYWYQEIRENGKVNGLYLEQELNNGFLNAENNSSMKFGLMWCNHDVELNIGICKGVFPDSEEFDVMTDYVIENYFSKSNYMKIDGKIYFGIYDMASFVATFKNEYGKTDIRLAQKALQKFREKVRDAGYGEMIIGVFETRLNGVNASAAWPGGIPPQDWDIYKYLDIGIVTDFMIEDATDSDAPYIRYDLYKKGGVWDYGIWLNYQEQALKKRVSDFSKKENVMYMPGLPVGYDPTVRISPYEEWDPTLGVYPNERILWNNTPENVGKYAKKLRDVMDDNNLNTLFVYSWNEWGESSYLEPDTYNGYNMLRVIKNLFTKE